MLTRRGLDSKLRELERRMDQLRPSEEGSPPDAKEAERMLECCRAFSLTGPGETLRAKVQAAAEFALADGTDPAEWRKHFELLRAACGEILRKKVGHPGWAYPFGFSPWWRCYVQSAERACRRAGGYYRPWSRRDEERLLRMGGGPYPSPFWRIEPEIPEEARARFLGTCTPKDTWMLAGACLLQLQREQR